MHRLLDALGPSRPLGAADPADTTVHSLVALFPGPLDTDELRFEALLWSQLQRLTSSTRDVARPGQ